MVGTFAAMANKKLRRVYLREWRNHAMLTQKQLADDLDVENVTVSRWETGARQMDVSDLTSIAGILSRKLQFPIEPQDLFRHPATLSLDSMMRNTPEPLRKQAEALLRALKGWEGEK